MPSTFGANRMGTQLSASKLQETKTTIKKMDKENFSASLASIEPFLLNEAGSSVYNKSLKRINAAAKGLGLEVPADYAKAAKATQKRREKQDVFIQGKEAERLEAEAAAAEAAAAEAEAVEEVAEEPVEA